MGMPHVSPSYFARIRLLAGAMAVIVCGLCLRTFGYDVGLPFVVVKYGGSVLWGAMIYLLLAAFFPSRWHGYEVTSPLLPSFSWNSSGLFIFRHWTRFALRRPALCCSAAFFRCGI